MNAHTRILHSIFLSCLVLAPGSSASDRDNPTPPSGMTFAPISQGGLGLEVPPSAAERGVVYHLLPGRSAQATFRSETAIETFQGETDGIIGFAVLAPPDELDATLNAEAPSERGGLVAAEFALPVTSIRTGIDMRDRHLLTEQWLDASNHPYIRFRLAFLADPVDATADNAPEGSRTLRGKLVGDMTIRGVTRPLHIENASIAVLPESDATRRVAPGDLMALRCRFSLTLSDFGIDNPIVGRQVAKSVAIDQVLYFSNVAPTHEAGQSDDSPSEDPSNEAK